MLLDFMTSNFKKHEEKEAVVWRDQIFSYGNLLELIHKYNNRIEKENIKPGSVVILEADFSPQSIALFIVLTNARCILVPLSSAVSAERKEFIEIAQGEFVVNFDDKGEINIKRIRFGANHELYSMLRSSDDPGLVLFSSGSTGKSKASLHNLKYLLEKFKIKRKAFRSIAFLLFDHIGGVNTMLYNLSNCGCIVTVKDRSPDGVLSAIEKYKVELLPTSPTFINLILLSEAYKRYDLTTLKLVSYGTESMPMSTLERFHQLFPNKKLLQTYGLSEVGILRSKSKRDNSLWFKIGGEGYQTRIVDGILHIKAQSAMLGYLNYPQPFTEDGWFITGDVVEQKGDYIKILGRKSEVINVGGEKVFPTEVESVIQCMTNVADVTVQGEKNAITGEIVCTTVTLKEPENHKEFRSRLRSYCSKRLQTYKVPVKVRITDSQQYGARFKRMRRQEV